MVRSLRRAPQRRALTGVALGAALALGRPAAPAAAQATAPPAAETAPQGAGPAAVAGLVRDSLAGAALAGAAVHLVPAGTPGAPGRVAVTDSTGRFRLDSIAPGRYLAGFLHPRLDTLGLEPPTRVVEVGPGAGEVRADLALPGAHALAAAVCGARGDSTGVLLGRVLDAEGGEPVPGGAVVVRWGEVVVDRRGVRRVVEERRGPVGPGGRYAVCGVPAGDDVAVQAVATLATVRTAGPARGDSAVSGVVEVRLPVGAPWLYRELLVDLRLDPRADLRVAASSPTIAAASTAVPPPANPTPGPAGAGGPPAALGTAALAGRVRAPDGRPLAGARVVVRTRAAGGDPVLTGGGEAASDAVAVTDGDGAYRLGGLPAGTRAVAVFALGHTPARAAADLRPGRVTAADFTAGPRVVTLEGVRVSASRVNPASEFARHRRRGFGYFYDTDALARRRPNFAADLLVGAPGLRVAGMTRGRPILRGRFGCTPALFVDGVRVPGGDTAELDAYVSPGQVGALEVYSMGMEAPAPYAVSHMCPVVLLWTKGALR